MLRAWIRRLLRDADCVVGQSRNTLDNMRNFYTPEIDGIRIPLGIERPEDVIADLEAAFEHQFDVDDAELVDYVELLVTSPVQELRDCAEARRIFEEYELRDRYQGSPLEQTVLDIEAALRDCD